MKVTTGHDPFGDVLVQYETDTAKIIQNMDKGEDLIYGMDWDVDIQEIDSELFIARFEESELLSELVTSKKVSYVRKDNNYWFSSGPDFFRYMEKE